MNRFTRGGRENQAIGRAVDATRDAGLSVDVHQHIWPEPLVDALRRRTQPPCLHGWTLELAGEPEFEVDPGQHDVAARAAQAAADGLDLVLVSLSSPLGIETLPPGEAHDLIRAYHDRCSGPRPFLGWAAACMTEIDPVALQRELDRGFVGLQLPATELLDGSDYERAGSLLRVLEATGRPLFVHPGAGHPRPGPGHPGPGPGHPDQAPATPDQPSWWAPVVTYVQQMHAAWFAFRLHGRPRHPRLRVCFAMLAGLAPLHGERFAARGGGRTVIDPDSFLESPRTAPGRWTPRSGCSESTCS